ncbi:DNA ligase 4 [Rickenella mellea]|uniref:DNA ligase n=1 Tax=Rickenella mellea TaxID=50990 RepID=A0A4Y7Q995_9AGAM|nr:DNA ligase 4 [Rickenella mellea]
MQTPSPTASPRHSESESQNGEDAGQNSAYPPPPPNLKSPPFSVLVGLYEKLQNEKKPDKRRKALASWFNHWREEIGFDMYPVLRLLLPQKDRERSVYGLKEKNLAKTYIKLIPLGMKDPDAVRLLNWKKPTEKDKTSGDFPTVLYEVISKRSSVIDGTLTVDDVNNILDDICKDMGKQEIQSKLLQRVYNKATPEDQRWIARIILKDMNIMVKETTVFSVFHPDAHDLFNTCSDLKKVAHELWDPSRKLNDDDKSIQLFRAFAPMLCKRPAPKIEESIKTMEGRTFIIEEKLDGERIQLHKRENEYFYCSRKGKDYTYLYGKHVGTGSLTPYIDQAFDERVEDIILDGEMLVWDPVSERNLPFGTLKTAALDKAKKELSPRPCFKVFDLLYLNGMCLAKKSVRFRKKNLRACVKEVKGRIEFITEFDGKTADDVRKRMEDVVEDRGEGLIIKHPNSEYVLNGRNQDWIKIKPEYMDNMGETVDVLVVGGNYGSGKRSGGVSTLICAVMDDRRKGGDDDEPKYSTFVRIGSGLTYADYVWIRQKPWKSFDKNNMPSWYQASKKGQDDKGDVYLEPEDSFILKVKAAEITPTDQYHLGFTMRFPRALSIRDDLSIADCMTSLAVLDSMKSERKRKMEDKDSGTKKKRKTATKKNSVMPEYQGASLRGVQIESDLFQNLKFNPKSRTGEQDKRDLLRVIHVNGGSYVQIPSGVDPILVVYGGTTTPYDLKLMKDKDLHDIIRPQWIHDCIAAGELVPLRKKYFFHATTSRVLDKDYNDDGDEDKDHLEDNMYYNDDAANAGSSGVSTNEPTEEEHHDGPDKTEDIKDDDELSEWFKVGGEPGSSRMGAGEADSETDPDSGNEEETLDADDNTAEWFKVSSPTRNAGKGVSEDTGEPDGDQTLDEDVQMGEDKDATEYDQDSIFLHLCFYLDTPENAVKHGMTVKSKHTDQITTAFAEVKKLITENGGRVVDLDEPRLTHIVLDKRDDSRRKELMRLSSVPKRRNLVISDFIQACVEEDTLLDEEGFAP